MQSQRICVLYQPSPMKAIDDIHHRTTGNEKPDRREAATGIKEGQSYQSHRRRVLLLALVQCVDDDDARRKSLLAHHTFQGLYDQFFQLH